MAKLTKDQHHEPYPCTCRLRNRYRISAWLLLHILHVDGMIKYTKRPNIETLRRRCKDDRDIINTIRHEFTNYSKVQDAVYASEDAVSILRTFFRSVVALDKNLGCEAAAQFGNHIKRIAR